MKPLDGNWESIDDITRRVFHKECLSDGLDMAQGNVTALICGDPPPGRSALDKKMAQAIWRKA